MAAAPRSEARQRLTTLVAYVITAAWTVSFTADLFVDSYEPPPSVTPLMLTVAGYCFSDGVVSRIRRPSTTEERDERAQ